jgi:selenocysteine lyase/cysteine desulfurase
LIAQHYLNNAGTSFPKPQPVLEAIKRALNCSPGDYPELIRTSVSTVAQHLGVSRDRLLLTTGCSQALDVAITELPWAAGDRVITSHLEHHAVNRPLGNLVRQRGVVHLRAPYTPGSPFDLAFLEHKLKEGRVKLVAVSTASNVTGEILPLATISQLARGYGALVLADAAQTFGLLDDALPTRHCDLLTFAGHKGPLGPQGVGGLWASETVSFASPETACELGAPVCAAPMPGYCDVGGINVAGLSGVAAGLVAWGAERAGRNRRAQGLAAALAAGAREISKVTVFGHRGGPQTAAVSLVHQNLPVARAAAYFASCGIVVRAGAHCAPDALVAVGAAEGTVRLSFGPHSSHDDLNAALRALEAL